MHVNSLQANFKHLRPRSSCVFVIKDFVATHTRGDQWIPEISPWEFSFLDYFSQLSTNITYNPKEKKVNIEWIATVWHQCETPEWQLWPHVNATQSRNFRSRVMHALLSLEISSVDTRYLEFQWTPWNTSRYPYFDISDLQNWGKNHI